MTAIAIPHGANGKAPTQTLAGASNTAGAFTLAAPDGVKTTELGFAATALQVEEALNALRQVQGNGGVVCSGGPLNTTAILITYKAAAAREGGIGNTPLAVANGTVAISGGTALTVVQTTFGLPPLDALPGSGILPCEAPHVINPFGTAGLVTPDISFFNASWAAAPAAAKVGTGQIVPSSGQWTPPRFYVDQTGFVHLEGLAEALAAQATSGKVIAQITDERYLPAQAVASASSGGVVVQPNGKIEAVTTVLINALIPLDLEYRAKFY